MPSSRPECGDRSASVTWLTPVREGQSRLQRSVDAAYREHRRDVFRWASRYANGDRDWTEDVVHETFLQLVRHARRIDWEEPIRPWLYRTTVRRCLSRLRNQSFRRSPLVRWLIRESASPPPEPLARILAKSELAAALQTLEELPPKCRVAFVMFHLDELPQKEIAEVLGLSKGYVSKLIDRAERTIRSAGWRIDSDG